MDMEWVNTLIWVLRGNAVGLALFLAMVVAVYTLVPLETPRVQEPTPRLAAQHQGE